MYKKKLIETSIPLDEINAQAVREKSIRKGHPSTLHLWWARRPLAAARCVIFASMVDDPAEHPEFFATEGEQDKERERLHGIIKRLANWDNINDERLYQEAFAEMVKYAPDGVLPEFLDPFAGGGALPLEAQRLGLVSHAADLNPVPVTLNRAMIDIPARFCDQPPVHPGVMGRDSRWDHAAGLAEDVRYYAGIMREEAGNRLAKNYPSVEASSGGVSRKATPIAYIWARTVKCPNPACCCDAPLVRSFVLTGKKGRRAYIEPKPHREETHYCVRFERAGWRDFDNIPSGTVGRRGAVCLHCGSPISLDYIRSESREHGLGEQMMAVVSESPFGQGRWYSSATVRDIQAAKVKKPSTGFDNAKLAYYPGHLNTVAYGLEHFNDLFSPRQLVAMVAFSDLIGELRGSVECDAIRSGLPDDGIGLSAGGCGARAYAEAISVYLAFMVDKLADRSSAISSWDSSRELIRNVFARQAIPMTWDYAEVNPLSGSGGSFASMVEQVVGALGALPARPRCDAVQRDAAKTEGLSNLLVSTDPPYYDNIGYADLSDFFYVWMRRSLRAVFPQTFATLVTPKADELVAVPFHFEGGKMEAKHFFENGMAETFKKLANAASDDYPMTVYYAYKQVNDSGNARDSSGWETMLQALMNANLQITGTWPMRTEMANRSIAYGSNALASSIVLVCRKRGDDAPVATRPEFQRELRRSLREGVEDLQGGSIAPVDMAQAAIGPGMAAFSKFAQVLESDGTPMSVHTALGIINEQLDVLMGESGESFDAETRFCITWYEQFGFAKGDFGAAETLRNARGASFVELERAGVLVNDGGKTWLVSPARAAAPEQMRIFPSVWTNLMAAIVTLETGGVAGAARFISQIDAGVGEQAKSLAYVLFQAAERSGRTEDATLFNDIVTSWADISESAEEIRRTRPVQYQLDFNA